MYLATEAQKSEVKRTLKHCCNAEPYNRTLKHCNSAEPYTRVVVYLAAGKAFLLSVRTHVLVAAHLVGKVSKWTRKRRRTGCCTPSMAKYLSGLGREDVLVAAHLVWQSIQVD